MTLICCLHLSGDVRRPFDKDANVVMVPIDNVECIRVHLFIVL